MRILLSRTDSLGDVVLTLPMAGLIKEKYPEAYVLFLGNNYTKDVIKCCAFVDEFVNWSEFSDYPSKKKIAVFKNLDIDVFIHVFPDMEIARLACKARIRTRIGTSHRLFHYLYCNVREHFTRRNSNLHESQLNIKLLNFLGIYPPESYHELSPFMGFSKISALDKKWADLLSNNMKNIILHPKSKGSAREWGLDNFKELIHLLLDENFKIFLTGTEEEGRLFREELFFNNPRLIDLSGKLSLKELIAFISAADVLLAASTGPLHIAAACGIHTIGIYPPVRPIHPGRWAPVGVRVSVLSSNNTDCKRCVKKRTQCLCMSEISPAMIKKILL